MKPTCTPEPTPARDVGEARDEVWAHCVTDSLLIAHDDSAYDPPVSSGAAEMVSTPDLRVRHPPRHGPPFGYANARAGDCKLQALTTMHMRGL